MANISDSDITEARKKLARKIRQLRRKKGWTQQKLADEADITMRHVQRLESTNKTPAIEIDSILRISKAFNISASSLLKF